MKSSEPDSLVIPGAELEINGLVYEILLDHCGAYVYVKDLDGVYVYVNEMTRQLFNRPLQEILGHDDTCFFDLERSTAIRQNDRRVLEKGETVVAEEINFIKETGAVRVYKSIKKPIYNRHGKIVGLVGLSTDITEIYNLKEALRQSSLRDELTMTANRRAYVEAFQQALAHYRRYRVPFSLILFDIDDFKGINDRFGHDAGDDVLVAMAAMVRSRIRKNDTLFRLGGEEFMVLLPCTALPQAAQVAEKIRSGVADHLHVLKERRVTISAGVAEVREDDDEQSMYRRVDELLYRSKRAGKNTVSQ
ncbi:MAG: diguanylate cyclase [Lysobacteraceae bacterium]|nr:MAG: diguanylate cyclase [Xanthomonadaceae bacterium]